MKELLNEGYFGALRRFAYQFGVVGGWAPGRPTTCTAERRRRRPPVEGSAFPRPDGPLFRHPDSCAYSTIRGRPEATVVFRFGYRGGARLAGEARLSKTVPRREGFALETATGIVIFREDDDAAVLPVDRPRLELAQRRAAARRSARPRPSAQLADFVAACRTGGGPGSRFRRPRTQRLHRPAYAARRPGASMDASSQRPAAVA